MIKNFISFIIPLMGLLFLAFSFHFLDKYSFPVKEEESNVENQPE
ncbi:hypothetical protein [Calidifontibacillus oryziterrae]|nr:hypothetical protein [Calidifontibacillus oryziterrae]